MRALALLAGLAGAFGSGGGVPAFAQEIKSEPRAVVELFTSQGCASCPPADALLSELDGRDDVVALAYHVDYWDYIGWPDTFGSEANSNRQRAYAAGWGSSRIFTPQMVINGVSPVVGSKSFEVHRALGQAELPVAVEVDAVEGMLEIEIGAAPGQVDAMVWLVGYLDTAQVAIERGENEGRSIVYSQVVVSRQGLGLWSANEGMSVKIPVADALGESASGVAVLLQNEVDGVPGPIVGAALFQP